MVCGHRLSASGARSPEDEPRLIGMGEMLGGARKALTHAGWEKDNFSNVPDWKQRKVKVIITNGR